MGGGTSGGIRGLKRDGEARTEERLLKRREKKKPKKG